MSTVLFAGVNPQTDYPGDRLSTKDKAPAIGHIWAFHSIRALTRLPPQMTTRYLGAPITRNEDRRLLTGRALFVNDVERPGMLHVAFLRSPHAHARLGTVDLSPVRARQGWLPPTPPMISATVGSRVRYWCRRRPSKVRFSASGPRYRWRAIKSGTSARRSPWWCRKPLHGRGRAGTAFRYVTQDGPPDAADATFNHPGKHLTPREEDGDKEDLPNDSWTCRLGRRSLEISQTRGAIQLQPC
jgi:Aldehyde oxidase and xanthine dehydrogenase, a/b hammerhead domain